MTNASSAFRVYAPDERTREATSRRARPTEPFAQSANLGGGVLGFQVFTFVFRDRPVLRAKRRKEHILYRSKIPGAKSLL